MALTSFDEAVAAYDALQGRAVEALSLATTALSQGTYTGAQIRGVRAALAGTLEDVRLLQRQLDGTRAVDLLVVVDGLRTIQAWKWRLATRRQLVRIAAALLAADRVAADLDERELNTAVVAREGDTLQSVAARELGDWREWPRLLEANPDLEPGAVAAGTTIEIPERR